MTPGEKNKILQGDATTGLILSLHPANERYHYPVTPSLIGWAQIFIEIRTFSLMKIHFIISFGKWWPFCFGLNVVRYWLDAVKQSSHHDPYLSRRALLEVVAEHTKHDVTSCHKQCLVRGYHPIIHNKPDIWRATKTSVFRKSMKQHPHYLTH